MPDQNYPKRRFVIGTTIDGYTVIDDETGRQMKPIMGAYETAQQANGACYGLNTAMAAGPKALARALRSAD